MNSPDGRRNIQSGVWLLFLFLVMLGMARGCNDRQRTSSSPTTSIPVENPIEQVILPATPKEYRDGVAAIILIDTSGSMRDEVKDANGERQPKIDIAQRAAIKLVEQFDQYAREHAEKPISLGIYEFSDREGEPFTRPVIPPGPPDASRAQNAIMRMRARGGTPIGNAMIQAKLALDQTGLSKRHIVVITDGENTKGYSPLDVTQAIVNQSENDRASIYFVAFDVASSKFDSVRDAGGLVLAASNETDLRGTLDYLLTGKILAEQPQQR
jgi:hypothetical protein